jgi:hypothetical protein
MRRRPCHNEDEKSSQVSPTGEFGNRSMNDRREGEDGISDNYRAVSAHHRCNQGGDSILDS